MRQLLAVLLAISLLLPAAAGVAAAQSQQVVGGSVVVQQGETVTDMTAYGGTVTIRGTVEGDLTAFAGRVVVTPSGEVTGRIRAFGGSVLIDGTVGGNGIVYAGQTTVSETGSIGDSLGVFGGGAAIDGTVGGDATIGTGSVTLGPQGRVDGLLVHAGRLEDEGGEARFGTKSVSDLSLFPSVTGPAGILVGVYLLVAELFAGGLLLAAFPEFSRDAVETTLEQPQRLAAAGIVCALAVPIAVALLAITIVGLPLALATLALFVLLLWVGSLYGRYLVGATVLTGVARARDRSGKEVNPYLGLLVGLVLVALLAAIPLLGGLVRAIVSLFGLGAVALGLYLAYRSVRERRAGYA